MGRADSWFGNRKSIYNIMGYCQKMVTELMGASDKTVFYQKQYRGFGMKYKQVICTGCVVGMTLSLSTLVYAQVPQNIIRDYQTDIGGDPDRPFRVHLKKQVGVKLGRMAGIWGTIGGKDSADSFYLGKTPDKARMQFNLVVLEGGGDVTLAITTKEGKNSSHYEIVARPGKESQAWYRLKGKIMVRVTSRRVSSSNYALYFWYPGGVVDALKNTEFKAVNTSRGRSRQRFVSATKGDNK